MIQTNFLKTGAALLMVGAAFTGCLKDYDNPSHGTGGDQVTIFALRQMHQGSDVPLSASNLGGAYRIQGVVISDKGGNNLPANTFIIQQTYVSSNSVTDITRGIAIQTGATPAYSVGDSVQVDLSGTQLKRVNGRMTVTGVDASKISTLATGKTPFIRAVTQGLLQDAMDQYESTLISINADVADYGAGGTLAGAKKLNDNTGSAVYLHTLSGATFGATALPMDAQFTGIAGYYKDNGNDTSGALKTVMLRNASDIQFVSGVLYPGFPESFEAPDATTKSSYNSGTNLVSFNTGSWYLLQAIIGNTLASDRINSPGRQGIRVQQNLTTSALIQMNFDVADGASKVTVFYGKYGTDAKSSFRLEYSTNAGTTWITTGATITDLPDKGMKQAVWTLNLTGPVRFRINKLGTGTSNNGRLSLDDFAIYKKL